MERRAISSSFAVTFLLFLFAVDRCQAQNYVAEGYFVLDAKALDIYMREFPQLSLTARRTAALAEARKDIDYLLTQSNLLLSTLAGVNIQIRVLDLDFEDAIPSPLVSGNTVSARNALAGFDYWLQIGNGRLSKPNFDFAILWTGYDIEGTTTLVAHTGQVCNQLRATAVVEYNGIYEVAKTTVRALAYILGAGTDGHASQHIMARVSRPSNTQRWDFNPCTASDIVENLQTFSSNCLLTTSSASVIPSTSVSRYSGKMYNYDDVCVRQMNNSQSYICRNPSLYNSASPPKGDSICSTVYCGQVGSIWCQSTYATEGFICDQGKRCKEGSCQPDSSYQARIADPDCILGDRKYFRLSIPSFSGSCEDFLNRFGRAYCRYGLIQSHCCVSCRGYSVGKRKRRDAEGEDTTPEPIEPKEEEENEKVADEEPADDQWD